MDIAAFLLVERRRVIGALPTSRWRTVTTLRG
jgi:hypothetical protein